MTLKRITDTIRQLGRLNGLLYLAHRTLSSLTGDRVRIVRYHIVAQPVPEISAAPLRSSTSTQIAIVDRDNPLVAAFPRPPGVISRRFDNNNTCIAATSANRFTGYIWIAREHYAEDEVRCIYRLENSQLTAWDYDVYVEPDFRIGRTFARLWDAANKHLSEQGVQWSISRISAFNPGSLQAHRRLQIEHLFSATFLCIGELEIMLAGSPPYLSTSLQQNSTPTLSVRAPNATVGTEKSNRFGF